jgi:NADH:ubiquinone oxidoreductase subunit
MIAVLLKSGAIRSTATVSGETAYDISVHRGNLDCELFLGSEDLPEHATGVDFLIDMNNILDDEIGTVVFSSSNVGELKRLNRRLVIFDELVAQRYDSAVDELDQIREELRSDSDAEIARILRSLSDVWRKRAEESRALQAAVAQEVYTVEGWRALQKWEEVTEKRTKLLDDIVQKYRKTEPDGTLKRAQERVEVLGDLKRQKTNRTRVYQNRILALKVEREEDADALAGLKSLLGKGLEAPAK